MTNKFSSLMPFVFCGALLVGGCTLLTKQVVTTTPVVTVGANGTSVTNNVSVTNTVPKLTPDQVEQLGRALEAATKAGAVYAGTKDANAKPYFVAAANVIDLALADGKFDPDALSGSLANVSVKEISNDGLVQSVIIGALSLYSVTYGDVVAQKLDQIVYLAPMLKHFAAGLRAGGK